MRSTPSPPFNRLDQMGAFWIAARRRDQVTAVDHVAITLKTRSGVTLRIYRHAPHSTASDCCR
jgi:hypothetical protein